MLRRRDFKVSVDKSASSFLYREKGRTVRVSGETMADGYAVYSSSIKHWEATPGELIDDNDRLRITANIRSYLLDRGSNVYIA